MPRIADFRIPLLLALLLAMQLANGLHAVDFDAHGEGEPCELCLAASAQDDVVGAGVHYPVSGESGAGVSVFTSFEGGAGFRNPQFARAPPHQALH